MSGTPCRQAQPGDIVTMHNYGATAIAINRHVMPDTTGAKGVKYPTATTDSIIGVTVEEIPAYGDGGVQVSGVALVCAHGAFATPMTKVMTTASTGRAVAFSAGAGTNAANCGLALNTALAQDDLLETLLPGPCVIEQG
jgi:hypothetical protein